jgi:hypothetical protein
MRAQDLLPDGADSAQFNDLTVRKGTVGAFLLNARAWLSRTSGPEAKAKAELDILEALPALRALGVFEVFTVNDPDLRAMLDRHISGA